MLKTPALLATAFMLTVAASPAQAGGHSWKIGNDAYHIYFEDLDLTTVEGRAAALARTDKASARLCETQPTGSDRKECVAEIGARVTSQWIALARLERKATERALAAR